MCTYAKITFTCIVREMLGFQLTIGNGEAYNWIDNCVRKMQSYNGYVPCDWSSPA